VAAAVELLFQGLYRFAIRGVLFAGGNKGGNAPLQAGVLGDGSAALADEGAASSVEQSEQTMADR